MSIVNWIKNPEVRPSKAVLDGIEVETITASLRSGDVDVSAAVRLDANAGRAFQGPIPAGAGFVLSPQEADELLATPGADYSRVVRPYLVGDDIANDASQGPSRWIIDFATMDLEEAQAWPAALKIVRERVKPVRANNRRKLYRERWWNFAEPRPGMRRALELLERYVAANRIGKRILVVWQQIRVCPSDLTIVFAFEDDFSIGILASALHQRWARAQSSTLRVDIRYTPTSAFETFPWPAPTEDQRSQIGALSKVVIQRRQEICGERDIGLTRLYNEVEEGAYRDLRAIHRQLDEAVAAAYGWPASAAHDPIESNRRLLELNRAIAVGEVEYNPFA